MHNFFKTTLLMAAMAALFMTIGFMIGGTGGMMIALLIACGMNFFAYWKADKVVLKMYKARPVSQSHAFYRMVANLAQNADLPMPKVYIIANEQPNAFATGRNPENAAVAATTGLLDMLNEREIAGVMAHELAHVQNRDTLTMTITATLAGAISMLANFAMFTGGGRANRMGGIAAIAMMFLAPLAASLVQMAVSRTREYSADRRGAEICGDPEALASALQKIEHFARGIHNRTAEANPASASLFIINPLSGKGGDALFSTHPRTQNRIERLMAMVGAIKASDRPLHRTASPWG